MTVLVVALLGGALLELGLRAAGREAWVRDGPSLWAYWRRRVTGPPGEPLVLVGASRLVSAVDLALFSRLLGGRRVVQLGRVAQEFLPVFEDLCADETFRGTILLSPSVDFFVIRDRAVHDASASFRAVATAGPSAWACWDEDLSTWVGGRLQERLVLARGLRIPFGSEGIFNRILRFDGTRYRFDRSGRRSVRWRSRRGGDEKTRSASGVDAIRNHILAMRRRHADTDPARFEALVRERILPPLARLRARGGRLVLLCMPISGDLLAWEQAHLPRARFFDRLVALTGAPAVHWQDEPELRDFTCLDWSHLEPEWREPFTRALAGVLSRLGPSRASSGPRGPSVRTTGPGPTLPSRPDGKRAGPPRKGDE